MDTTQEATRSSDIKRDSLSLLYRLLLSVTFPLSLSLYIYTNSAACSLLHSVCEREPQVAAHARGTLNLDIVSIPKLPQLEYFKELRSETATFLP